MKFKKIISIATAAVVAAGICISAPTGVVGSPLAVITAEAASSKYPEFPVTENGDGTVTVKMSDGSKVVGKVTDYYHGRTYSNGEYSQSHITIYIKETKLKNGDRLLDYLVIWYNPKTGKLSYDPETVSVEAGEYFWGVFTWNQEGDYINKYVEGDWLLGETKSGKIEVLDYYGNGGDIVIPEGAEKITSDNIFANNDRITSVTFPKSFNDSCGVFKNCKNLKKVEIKGNASFPTEAFKDCTNLKSVIVKGKLCVNNGGMFIGGIGDSAFENCTSLETFKIYKMACEGEGKTWYIAVKAFKNCKSLKTINIPDNCTGIEKEAFKNCISLETVKISAKCEIFRIDDNGVKITSKPSDCYLSESAFENCYSLKTINIPKRFNNIKEKAFLNCYNLAELKIPATAHLSDYSVGYIYSDKKYTVADGKKTVTYTNAEGEKVKVTPKQITLTVSYLSNAEVYYANKNNIKYKYTDGTSPSSIPAPKASIRTDIDYNYNMKKYLTIDTSDGAAFYRLYKKDDKKYNNYETQDYNENYEKYVFYKDVTSANNLFVDWGSYVVVAYYKDKNGNYITSRPTDML